jgi:hypothetical protein
MASWEPVRPDLSADNVRRSFSEGGSLGEGGSLSSPFAPIWSTFGALVTRNHE